MSTASATATASVAPSSRSWSDEQGNIFDWFTGGEGSTNLIVRARAGTGKTTTIIEAVQRAPERSILMAAFNKSIADELTSRIPARHVEAKTLHGLGFRFIRRMARVQVADGMKRARDLAERACPNDAPRAIVNLVAKLHTKARDINPWLVLNDDQDASCDVLEEFAMRFDLTPEGKHEALGYDIGWIAERALRAMVLAMERTPQIDFADMIFLPIVKRWIEPLYDLVVVDEAQDMTPAQLALARGACREHGRVASVGDDRQAIYSFRGADTGTLDRLKEELEADELGLTTTYRCPRSVVELAAELVPDYRAAPNAPVGQIDQMIYGRMMAEASEGDFVLSRKNAPLVKACLAFLRNGVRARIKGRDVGRDILALVKKLEATDVADLVAKVDRWATKETHRAVERLDEEAAAARADYVHDAADVVQAIAADVDTMGEFETRCENLFADDAERAPVCLSTVHRAKGLEANTVYLLRDSFKRGRKGIKADERDYDHLMLTPDDELEEANIRYVAITRARQRLVWVSGDGK